MPLITDIVRRQAFQASGGMSWVLVIADAKTDPWRDLVFRQKAVANWTARPETDVIDGRMTSASFSDLSVGVNPDEGGGLAPSSRATVTLDATDLQDGVPFWDWLRARYILDGKNMEIRVNLDADTTHSSSVLVWGGVVRDAEQAGTVIRLECESRDSLYHRQFPPNIWQAQETGIYDEWKISPSLDTKPIPVVLGKVQRAEGFTIAETLDDGAVDRGMVVQFTDPSFGAGVKSIETLRFGDGGLVEATGGYGQITGDNPYTTDLTKGWMVFDVSPDTGARLSLWLFVTPRSWVGHGPFSNKGVDHALVIDGDLNTYGLVPATVTGNQTNSMYFRVPRIGLSGTVGGGGASNAFIYAYWSVSPASSGWSGLLRYYGVFLCRSKFQNILSTPILYYRSSAATHQNNIDGSHGFLDFPIRKAGTDWGLFDTTEKLSDCYVGIAVTSVETGVPAPELRVYEFSLLVNVLIDWPDDGFFATVEGVKDWATNTITGVPDALIENPAHLMSLIWRNATGSVLTDNGKFQDLALLRPGWKFGRQIKEREDTSRWLDELGKASLLWTYAGQDGKPTGFPMTGIQAGEESFELSRSIVTEILAVSRLPAADTANAFVIKYKYNPVASNYSRSIACNANEYNGGITSGQMLQCQWARDRLHNGRRVDAEDLELPWIEDEYTAVEFAKLYIRRKTMRPWRIEWKTDIGNLWLALGDPVTIPAGEWGAEIPMDAIGSAGEMPPFVPGVEPRRVYRIVEIAISPEQGEIRYTAQEVYT